MNATAPSNSGRVRGPKLHLKVRLKIEQIARLRSNGIKDKQILVLLTISQGCLSRILRLQEYKDAENALLIGSLSTFDELIAQKTDAMKKYFAAAIPASMRALVDTVLQKRDLKARLDAARELLDRDPKKTFTKDKTRAEGDESYLPEKILTDLGKRGEALVTEVSKAELGPSGKPN